MVIYWHGIPQKHIAANRPGVRHRPQTLRTGAARPLLQRGVAAVRQSGLFHVLPDVPQLHRHQYRTGTPAECRSAAATILNRWHTPSRTTSHIPGWHPHGYNV